MISGFISKTITASDLEKGEVTIELKVSNTAKEVETNANTEMFLVIDNSPSMDFITASGQTRKNIVIDAAKGLVNSVFASSNNVKVGVIDFNGQFSSISSANLITALNNDKTIVLDGLDKVKSKTTVSGTNIDSGLQRAEKNFSSNCKNKVIVLLTDGIPTADCKNNNATNNVTTATAIKVQDNTKDTLQELEESGIYIISMLTGLNPDDGNTDAKGTVYEKESTFEEELAAVERLFGTESNPTAGKFYNISSSDVSNIVNNDIFRDVLEKIQKPIKNIVIGDFFPDDILDNFTFEYVGIPSIGTVTPSIDTTTKDITWDIGTLKGNEIATLKYKLEIKDMKNEALLNKVIATNEKVVLDYKDSEDVENQVILTSSPKIKLVQKEKLEEGNVNNNTNTNSNTNSNTSKNSSNIEKDNTVSTNILPKTGTKIVSAMFVMITVVGLIGYIRYKKLDI